MLRNRPLFLILFLLITSLYSAVTQAQEKPRSISQGYGKGGTIFEIPVYEPGKVDLDISSKYKKGKPKTKKKPKKSYPTVKIEKKPGTAKTPPASIVKTVKKNQKPTPKSLSKDYGKKAAKKPTSDQLVYSKSTNKRVIPFKPKHKPRRIPVIVIDPGHGGKDPGAIGRLGTKEKQITFLYSAELKRALERTGKYKVVLTRYGDVYVPLKSRVDKARKYNGDILISIHADSIGNRNVRGFSVYTISNNRAQREARKLLRKADREEVIRGVEMRGESRDVKEAIIDFAQKETKSVSDSFSKIVAKHLGQKVKPLNRTNREGSLAVLTGADIPSVLIELGYLSNSYEERLLRQQEHRRKIVRSIISAIDEYFKRFDYFLE